jgi:hypothetical protein
MNMMAFVFFPRKLGRDCAVLSILDVHCSVSAEHTGLNTSFSQPLLYHKLQLNHKIKLMRSKLLWNFSNKVTSLPLRLG